MTTYVLDIKREVRPSPVTYYDIIYHFQIDINGNVYINGNLKQRCKIIAIASSLYETNNKQKRFANKENPKRIKTNRQNFQKYSIFLLFKIFLKHTVFCSILYMLYILFDFFLLY